MISFEILDRIALISKEKKETLEKIKEKHPKIKCIYLKKISKEEILRIPILKKVYGKTLKTGFYTENKIKIYFNLFRGYFSVKLANDRKKILKFTLGLKNFLDGTCGFGLLGIMVQKKGIEVTWNDINHKLKKILLKNHKKNKVYGKIYTYPFELYPTAKKYEGTHINIPFKGIFLIPKAYYLLEKKGIFFVYFQILEEKFIKIINFLNFFFEKIEELKIRQITSKKKIFLLKMKKI